MHSLCLFCRCSFRKRHAVQKFCSTTCANRHNLNCKIAFVRPKAPNEATAEIFGILLGDGSVTEYFVKIHLNIKADAGYSKNILRLVPIAFPGIAATIYKRESRGAEEIMISSKNVCDYLRYLGFNPKNRTVPQWIWESDVYTKAAIRGLFDTEGSIGIKRYSGKFETRIYKQLTFTNRSIPLLQFVQNSLTMFGFKPTKTLNQNTYISNKDDIDRYFKIIGTSNPKLEKKLKIK